MTKNPKSKTSLARFLWLLVALWPMAAIAQSADDLLARGEYVFRISGCAHCHTAEDGEPLAGGRALPTPFGTFYSPNITSDRKNGIGAWSAADLKRALRHGVAPDGADYYPAFPYTSYTRLRDDDINAMHTYLMSLPASQQANREHDLAWYLQWRFAALVWKWLFFTPGEFTEQAGRDSRLDRGAYIAEAMGHCQECHTPRDFFGALRTDMAYAGNPHGPEDELVPNITSHDPAGIGDWSRDTLIEFLKYGELPSGEYTAGSMDAVISGLQRLSVDDREALTDYIRALPPNENRVRRQD